MAMVRTEGFCSMKNFSYTIENRTRDLPACSAVLQTPPRAPRQLYQINLRLSTDKGALTCDLIRFGEITVNEVKKKM
jgi:hypothetical protein